MTVKKTGGGAFNPAAAPMYFAAGASSGAGGSANRPVHRPKNILIAVNDVLTEASERSRLRPRLEEGHSILLDSGIFWLAQQYRHAHSCTLAEALNTPPEQMDGFDRLFTRYLELVHRYGDKLWGFIELDQGGAVNKRRIRAMLEAEGLTPIPVYHPLNDGWDYFDELATGYDRICMGNVVHGTQAVRMRLLHTLWERHRAYPDLWVHVLGWTPNEWCLAAPPDSCDSSTWLAPIRWPIVNSETAMLRRTPKLGPRFAYDLEDREAPGRDLAAAFNLCSDGVTNIGRAWTAAATRIGELTGQGLHPPYQPGEPPLTPPDIPEPEETTPNE